MQKLYNHTNETALIAAIKNRSQDSFEYIYNKYSGALWYTISRLVRDEQIADEILIQLYKDIYLKINEYNPGKESFFTWIFKLLMDTVKMEKFPKAFKSERGDCFID